jgi:hypothetical protein
MEKLKPRRLSEVSRGSTPEKALSSNKGLPEGFENENHTLLRHCRNLWDNLRDFRNRRRRSRRYQRGDQWSDLIYNVDDGDWMREDEYIRAQGKVPLKQNVIRQLIKNLQGQYRRNPTKTIVYARNREDSQISEMMSNAIQTVHELNHIIQLDASALMEFAISGACVGKYTYMYMPDMDCEDIFMTNVNPTRVFYNGDLEDPRMTEIRIIGEIHDLTRDEVVMTFAQNKKDEEKIKQWYSVDYYNDFIDTGETHTADIADCRDFYIPHNTGMCRVIEVWYKRAEWRTYVHDLYDGTYKVVKDTLDEIEQLNTERIKMFGEMGIPPDEVPLMVAERKYDQYWYVKYITPYGHTLYEGETPYDHNTHPYEIVLFPMIDGEVWGLVEDIIDQQRYINRTITLMDFIAGASAKGLLLVPESAIPSGMNIDDFADEWSRVGGVIMYKAKPGIPAPQQVSNSSIPSGLQEMLGMQLKLTYDIIGIHQAAQGQQPKSGTAAALYAQEAENASINIKDFMDTFKYWKKKRDIKVMKLVMQYYQEKRNLFGKNGGRIFDPEAVREVQFDLALADGPDTPVYRQVIEDVLNNLLLNQMIDLKMYLEHSTLPFADQLLETIKRKEQEMAQGGGPDQELMQAVGSAQQHMETQDPRLAQLFKGMDDGNTTR